MLSVQHILKNELLFIAYYINQFGWNSANKTTFQRMLYFSAVLSPIFVPGEKWSYTFTNTIFGPYNNEISIQLTELQIRGVLELEERKIISNRVEERYQISAQGIKLCDEVLFKIDTLKEKRNWLKIMVKSLTIYGENFLAKLVKEDPNIYYQNQINQNKRIPTDSSTDNLSKEFFNFIKENGREKFNINLNDDQDYLLLFFDALYRKYKGGVTGAPI